MIRFALQIAIFCFSSILLLAAPAWAQTAPTAKNASLTITEGTPKVNIRMAQYVTDPEELPYNMTYTLLTKPDHGTVQYYNIGYFDIPLNQPVNYNWYYLPEDGFVGTVSFTWLCNDGTVDSNIATHTIVVVANTLPTASESKIITVKDESIKTWAPFYDPDPIQTISISLESNPSHGDVTISGYFFTYTPDAGYTGPDQFSWKANDNFGNSNVAGCKILVRATNDRAGMLVLLIVNDLLLPEIESEVQRLGQDLLNDGYTSKLKTWNTTDDGGSEDLWNYINSEYVDPNQIVSGAILIGSMPTVRNATTNEYTDLVYWNMTSYRNISFMRHIWVSRFWATRSTMFDGQEVLRLKHALQANHDYRTGAQRLPHMVNYIMHAYPDSEPSYYPNDGANALEVWPEVEKSDILEAWLNGGELLDETMHGSAFGSYVYNKLTNRPCKTRVNLITSCGSGSVNGPANNLIYSRGGGAVLSIGASATTYTGAFTMLQNYGDDPKFRARLADGDTWGDGLVSYYPFGDNVRAYFFGDLSMPAMAAPANQIPQIDTFEADVLEGVAPLTVNFSATVSDPDGSVESMDWFCENEYLHMLKLNTGPTYTNNQRSQAHTYEKPYRYLAEVQSLDNFKAYSRPAQLIVLVAPTPGQSMRVNCGTANYVAKSFDPTQEFTDSAGQVWMHEQAYVSGTWGLDGRSGQVLVTRDVVGSEDDFLYQNTRQCRGEDSYGYRIPVENGVYTLRVGFADMKSLEAGMRLTNISVEGQPWLTGLDVFAEAGEKTALIKQRQIEVTDGEFNMGLSRDLASIENYGGLLSWFEIIPDDAINQRPVAQASADPSTGTAPLLVNFNASASSDSDGSIVTYAWDFGDGGTGTGVSVQHTYASDGSFTAVLSVTDDLGASATDTVQITVSAAANQSPQAVAVASPLSGEAPLEVSFDASASTDADGSIVSYHWDFGDGQSESSMVASHTYSQPGQYQVVLTVTDDGAATGIARITISVDQPPNQSPRAVASADPLAGDAPLEVNFDGTASSDPDGSIVSYAWDFGDSNSDTGSTVSHTYTQPGVYTAVLTVTDDGGAEATDRVTINVSQAANEKPIAVADANPREGYLPLDVSFDASASSDADGSIASYHWDFGDGQSANGATASHTYTDLGSFTVLLTVTDDQGERATATLVIRTLEVPNEKPIALATADPVSGMVSLVVEFSGQGSTDSDGNIISYAWDFGDGQSSDQMDASHTYSSAGRFLAILTVLDDDGASASDSIEIVVEEPDNSLPTAQIDADPINGTAPLLVAFDGSASSDSDGSIVSWDWDFGDGMTGSGDTIEHTFATAGEYTVILTVRDDKGASASTSVLITVTVPENSAPTALIQADPLEGYAPLAVNFDGSESADADGSIVAYLWNFGTGENASGVEAQHSFTEAGDHTVSLTVTDDMGESTASTLTIKVLELVNAEPVAVATATPTQGEAPLLVSFSAEGSADSDGSLVGYVWTFGDGQSAEGITTEHTYLTAGRFLAELTVMDDKGLTATATVEIVVSEAGNMPPTAVAQAEPISGVAPLDVVFEAGSSSDADGSLVSWAWSFGDGQSDQGVSLGHTYLEPGIYTVELIVTDDDGAIAMDRLDITVLEDSGNDDPGDDPVDDDPIDDDPQDSTPGGKMVGGVACASTGTGKVNLSLALVFASLLLMLLRKARNSMTMKATFSASLCALLLLAGCEGTIKEPHPSDLFDGAQSALAAVNWLQDASRPIAERRMRITALAKIDVPEAGQWLMQMGNQRFYLNWAAVEELGRTRHDPLTVSSYLTAKLKHADFRIAAAAAKALANFSKQAALTSLHSALTSNRLRLDGHGNLVCLQIVQSLGELASAHSIPALARELARAQELGWDLEYGSTIVSALEKIGGPASAQTIETYARLLESQRPDDPLAGAEFDQRIQAARASAAKIQ